MKIIYYEIYIINNYLGKNEWSIKDKKPSFLDV